MKDLIYEYSLVLGKKSPGTKKMYLFHLNNFFNHYKGKLEKISKTDILKYLEYKDNELKKKSKHWETERERGSSKQTNALFFTVLTQFYNHLDMFNIADMIKRTRKEYLSGSPYRMDVVALEPNEVIRLISAAVRNNEALIERDELIVRFLYTTGIRESELCNLTIDQLDLDKPANKVISIIGKGNKRRFIKLDGYTLKLYKKYYETCRNDKEPWAFTTFWGSKMHPHSIWEIIKKKADKANIVKNGKRISPHKLRSTFCTSLKEEDLLKRQELMGHNSPETTRLYTKFESKDLMNVKTPSSEDLK